MSHGIEVDPRILAFMTFAAPTSVAICLRALAGNQCENRGRMHHKISMTEPNKPPCGKLARDLARSYASRVNKGAVHNSWSVESRRFRDRVCSRKSSSYIISKQLNVRQAYFIHITVIRDGSRRQRPSLTTMRIGAIQSLESSMEVASSSHRIFHRLIFCHPFLRRRIKPWGVVDMNFGHDLSGTRFHPTLR